MLLCNCRRLSPEDSWSRWSLSGGSVWPCTFIAGEKKWDLARHKALMLCSADPSQTCHYRFDMKYCSVVHDKFAEIPCAIDYGRTVKPLFARIKEMLVWPLDLQNETSWLLLSFRPMCSYAKSGKTVADWPLNEPSPVPAWLVLKAGVHEKDSYGMLA